MLDGVSLGLWRGRTTSLVGESGTGKSTLLGVVAGLIGPRRGSIVFDGRDITALDETGWARLRAERIGYVLQSGNLVPFLTAGENVELAMGFVPGHRRSRRAAELLGEFGLAGRRDHTARRLSGGEAQRVAIAMALVNDPDLLLADEITGELDSATAALVMEVVLDVARTRGTSVLYVTHDAGLAAAADQRLQLADRTVGPA